jgi:hypothetical protein
MPSCICDLPRWFRAAARNGSATRLVSCAADLAHEASMADLHLRERRALTRIGYEAITGLPWPEKIAHPADVAGPPPPALHGGPD